MTVPENTGFHPFFETQLPHISIDLCLAWLQEFR
jgi:hypothetical protein